MSHGEPHGYNVISVTDEDYMNWVLLPLRIVFVLIAVRLEQHLMFILQWRILPLPLGLEEQGECITTRLRLAWILG